MNHQRPASLAPLLLACAALLLVAPACSSPGSSSGAPDARADASDTSEANQPPARLRVATFNASLYRDAAGRLAQDLAAGQDPQARQIAEIIQRARPDVILINEFDRDEDAAQTFRDAYLAVGQQGAQPLDYPHLYVPSSNTGEHAGVDLDGSGEAVDQPGSQAYGNDAFGFGTFPGQYAMVIYSRFPISADRIREFRTLAWSQMTDNLLPADWYSAEAAQAMRLSSKNHVDVPITVDGRTLHLLASHPTPPSFDGPEDRNGRRNHDEIRFWVDYIAGGERAGYIRDDAGAAGPLGADARFVILGDLNSDPQDGDSRREALGALLAHPRVVDPLPASAGAPAKAAADGRANAAHRGDPALDTADFSDGRVGNLRVDYALPSSNTIVDAAGVFWPAPDQPHADLVAASDHRLVWVDIALE